jgi:acetyl esterase/lipase
MRQIAGLRVLALAAVAILALGARPVLAQPGPPIPTGPPPTIADIAYAPADPAGSKGHLLDLYLPAGAHRPMPLVIWTGGSAWMRDTGKSTAGLIAARLNPAGFAVAGVSIRSSSQTHFPGQLYDIKAAIRWLRTNAARYGLDPDHIAIMGDSSGGWTTAMAAVTGDRKDLEGDVGTGGVSSAVQAAVVFFPPTDFLTMDAWALRKCEPNAQGLANVCHDGPNSPESQLIGCPIQTCPDKVRLADPVRYVNGHEPPIMILHGDSDALVPHNQGERLYQALNKACDDAVFISLPKGEHGQTNGFLTDDRIREGATIRSTARDCTAKSPQLVTPTWDLVIGFLQRALNGGA